MNLTLRQRLFALAVVALVPAIAIIVFNEITLRRSRVAETNDMALRSARLAASELDRVIEGVNGLLLAVSSAPAVRNLDAENCADYLSHLQNQVTLVTGIVAIDLQGGLRCSRNPPRPQQNYADAPFFRSALESGKPTVGGYAVGRQSGRPTLPVSLPIRGADGAVMGVLAAGIDLQALGQRLRERGLSPGGALTIADAEGVIVFREPFPERFLGTRIPDAFQRLVHAPSPGVETVVSQDGTTRVIGYIPATPRLPLYISAGLSSDASFEAIDRATGVGLLIALLGVAGALLGAREFGERFVQRPIGRILDAIRAWRGGDLTARVGSSPEQGEIEAVGAAFDGLMDEIARRHEERDLLIHELDHRVKNNLAIVQALVTQTLRREGVNPAVAAKLDDRLAALAKAHELLLRESWESAGLDDILEAVLRLQPPGQRERIVRGGPPVRLEPRAALAVSMVMHELLTNALKYGALSNETGRVAINWTLEDGALRLEWLERGGPSVVSPTRKGFGATMIERSLAGEAGGAVRIDYEPAGLRCVLSFPGGAGASEMLAAE
ncbi:cache domain-containing protein [Alsobacter sp. KACC 23698]|uniref:histidine kinase n=1 Tax=Alsobacter sp. KACC 23698 TaxID=3149229 RepID=A0AAU7J9D7_9HYPH